MPKVIIETIPHETHRYTTVGDWYYDETGEVLHIKVSKLSDWKREFLIAVHEFIEVMLCKDAGITVEEVDKFDMGFDYESYPNEEPGDNPQAPYVKQHCIATGVERLLAAELGVKWKDYEKELCDLPEVKEKE